MRFASALVMGFLCTSAVLAQDAKPDVKVTLKKLVEKRELAVEKTPFAGWGNGIEVTLHVDGPGVKGARMVGKLNITKATDDAGTDLTKQSGDAPKHDSSRFDEVRAPQSFGFGDNATKPTGFDVEVNLPTLSARSAKSLKQLSGTFQVILGGQQKLVKIKSIPASFGKKLDDPSLKEAGVTITLLDPAKPTGGFMMGDKDKSLSVTLEGSLDAMGEVSILDTAGKKLNNGSSWNDDGGKRTTTYFTEQTLPKDATLQIEVFPGQKIVTVPFEIKDVQLP